MADSMKELAYILGVSLSAVSHGLKRYYSGSRRTCYRKAVIDDSGRCIDENSICIESKIYIKDRDG